MKHKIVISILVALAVLLAGYGALVGYVFHAAGQSLVVKSDAIVVLGEAAMGGTTCFGLRCQHGQVATPHYNACLESRVDHAVLLYRSHYAPKIVMSGGTDPSDDVNEAEAMKAIAVQAGVPASDILLEDASTSTYENLTFSQKVLASAGLHSAIIVTDPATNARAGLVAAKLRYSYTLSPSTDGSCSHLGDYALREPLAIIYYFFSGKV